MVRVALGALRGLVFAKRYAGPVLRVFFAPFLIVARVLIAVVGIPLYRLYFFAQRLLVRGLGTARNRALALVTNKQLIHMAAIAVACVVGVANVSASGVRSETYGRQSILYGLVSADGASVLEVESSISNQLPTSLSYTDDPSVSAELHLDFTSFDSEYATTVVGGLAALPGSSSGTDSGVPVSKRIEVETYRVAEGDTLGGIATQYGLTLDSILWSNNLTLRSTLRIGQAILIPPVDGVLYTVKKGDTLTKIASTYGTDAEKIVTFNNLGDSSTLALGQSLVVPGGRPPRAVSTPNPTPVSGRTAPVPAASVSAPFGATPLSYVIAHKYGAGCYSLSCALRSSSPFNADNPIPYSSQRPAPKVVDTKAARGAVKGKGTWVWPSDWRVINQYFTWKHTGVDIDGDYTTNNYAAADGTIIYSGWRHGYGLTIEIDHSNGLVTRYAHNSLFYIKTGDVVKAGDAIALMGTTGYSTGTHLHFEIIKNGKFQNPLEYVR